MCRYCTKHKRKKWFLDEDNYKDYLLENKKRQNVLQKLGGYSHEFHLRDTTELLYSAKHPVHKHVVKYFADKLAKDDYVGQILTLDDALQVVDLSDNHVLFECACRKMVGDKSEFVCLNFGPLRDIVKTSNPHEKMMEIDKYEAKKILKESNEKGYFHEVYFAKAPFPTTLCNCNRKYCIALKDRFVFGVQSALLKGHEIAVINNEKCIGCKACLSRCPFGAMYYDVENNKAVVDIMKCFGCGLCTAPCKSKAIQLMPRDNIIQTSKKW